MATVTSTDGFWGPRTSSVDWCEPNYVYSNYIAEFWNTLSSVPIILGGLVGLILAIKQRYRMRYAAGATFLMLTGMGSVLFHGTLQFPGQVLDELSMVYAVSCYLYSVLEVHDKPSYGWLPPVLVVFNICFTITYILIPAYFVFFLGVFCVMTFTVFARSILMLWGEQDRQLRIVFAVGYGTLAAAFFLMWIPDNMACARVGWLHLHAWFHVCMSLVPNWCGVFTLYKYYASVSAERRAALATKHVSSNGARSNGKAAVNGSSSNGHTGNGSTSNGHGAALSPDAAERGEIPMPRIVLGESLYSSVYPYVELTWKRASDVA